MAESILVRKPGSVQRFTATVKSINVNELCAPDSSVHVYIKLFHRGALRFTSAVQKNVREAQWVDLNQSFECENNEPVFVEIHESRWTGSLFSDSVLGMFAVYPQDGKSVFESPIRWDVAEQNTTTRTGSGKVKMQLEKRS